MKHEHAEIFGLAVVFDRYDGGYIHHEGISDWDAFAEQFGADGRCPIFDSSLYFILDRIDQERQTQIENEHQTLAEQNGGWF